MGGGGAGIAGIKVKSANGVQPTKFQTNYAFGLITSLFFLWGFSYGLLDVLNKHFQQFFHITHLQSTLIQVAYFGAYIVYSPVAGFMIRKFGYKVGGVYHGLTWYCIGALMFWPSAHFEKFGAFVGSAFVIASGLATLEVTANSYVTVLGTPEQAAFRLNFSQAFNGLASFCGPLIASKYFFSGDNQNSLGSVQYVYLAVACLGALVMILFFFAKLPEITDEDMDEQQAEAGIVDNRGFWRPHLILGFFTQLMYVGAQVATASFVLNYLTDKHEYSTEKGAQLFSYMQITFMVARFVSTPLLRFFDPATVLFFYGLGCTVFSLVAALTGGRAGLASLFLVFFFESVCYPTTFTLATSNMGVYTKRAASLVVMGVGGGAFYPSAQGALADAKGAQISYVLNAVGFLTVALYGAYMRFHRIKEAKRTNLEAARTISNGSQDKIAVEDQKIEEPVHLTR